MSDQFNLTPGEPISYMGLIARDESGATIGEISDVVYDETTQQPEWLVVNPGTLPRQPILAANRANQFIL